MQKPIIAIDCDDVLASSAEAFLQFSNDRWGTRLTIEDIDEDWSKMWQIDEAETEVRAKEYHASGIISDYRHYDEALPVLEWLAQRYTLVVATSRNASINSETIAWIEKHYHGIFESIYFSGIYDDFSRLDTAHLLTKSDLLQQIGASYLIDDQPKHCISAVEHGMQSILFGDYPWSNAHNLPAGATRCLDWNDVREFFEDVTA